MTKKTGWQKRQQKKAERKRERAHQPPMMAVSEAAPLTQMPSKEEQHEKAAKPETQQKQKDSKNKHSGVGRMSMIVPFIFESVFQVVTWVVIAAAIGGIYFFASKENWRGVLWSCCVLICAVVVMLCIVAQNHFSTFGVEAEPSATPPIARPQPRAELRTFLIPANDPTPAHPCGEIPASMKVAFVGSMVTQFSSELKSFSLIRIAGEDVLAVEYNAPNAIVINATIRDESNNIVATIKKNVFHSYVPSGYEATNPDPHTVLVLDANDHIVLYVRYLNPQAIKVLGVFRQPPRPPVRVEEGRFFIGAQEMAMTVCGTGGGTDKDWWQMKAALVVE